MTQQHPWNLLANLLDEIWYIDTTDQLAADPFGNLADLTVALAS